MKTKATLPTENYEEFRQAALSFTIEPESDIIDEQVLNNPFNPKEIDIKSRTTSLDNIIKRLRNSEIDLEPDFQRSQNLWDPQKQSRLIESLLIKIPLPAFYFDGTNDNRWLVVDGVQRLTSIKNFVVDKTFQLTGLEYLGHLNGKKFDDLERPLQRQIEETEIVAYIINPGTPVDVKFNIFKRINTGGLTLSAQEIRHALNQGLPAKKIAELAELQVFKDATANTVRMSRMEDRDFVNRFVAFYLQPLDDYKTDMDTFLNAGMACIKNMTDQECEKMKCDFESSMVLSSTVFGQYAFRKVQPGSKNKKPINKALFEVWSVSFAKLNIKEREVVKLKKSTLFAGYEELMQDESFVDSISAGTGLRHRVVYRFKKIQELIKNTLT